MPTEWSDPTGRRLSMENERGALYRRMVELERRGMRFKREEEALREIERNYQGLIESGIFLLLIVGLDGSILACNRCVERFWGIEPGGAGPVSLWSLCPPGGTKVLKDLLLEASQRRVRSRVALSLPDDSRVWVEVELMPSVFREDKAIQMIGVDVTEKVILPPSRGADVWERVLDGCPGLLCCVLDGEGRLLYASRGYRAAAKRFLGHDCVVGVPYPPESNSIDRSLHDLLSSALLGGSGGMELVEVHAEGKRLWEVTASPLLFGPKKATGAVLRMAPLAAAPEGDSPSSSSGAGEAPASGLEFLNAVSDMLILVDRAGACLAANGRFYEALGLDPDLFVGKSLNELPLANDPLNDGFPDRLREVLRAGEGTLELRAGTGKGELLWLELRARPVTWKGTGALLLTCVDTTLLHRTQEQLRRVAVTDRTTGLLNRGGMEQVLVKELERAARYRGSLCLLFLDIDDFRRFNEVRGYLASDRALKTLMAALKNVLRPTDFLGRWGGDEFMILTPQSESAACQLADIIRDTARNGLFDRENSLSLSVGVAKFSREMDVSSFVGAAYDAMVAAKKAGGDRTVLAGAPDKG